MGIARHSQRAYFSCDASTVYLESQAVAAACPILPVRSSPAYLSSRKRASTTRTGCRNRQKRPGRKSSSASKAEAPTIGNSTIRPALQLRWLNLCFKWCRFWRERLLWCILRSVRCLPRPPEMGWTIVAASMEPGSAVRRATGCIRHSLIGLRVPEAETWRISDRLPCRDILITPKLPSLTIKCEEHVFKAVIRKVAFVEINKRLVPPTIIQRMQTVLQQVSQILGTEKGKTVGEIRCPENRETVGHSKRDDDAGRHQEVGRLMS